MPATIEQLNAAQLARHAFNVFLFSGRHETGARLIYRALELDSQNTLALRCLSDVMDADGTEIFSAVALEYALTECGDLPDGERRQLDDVRFLAKWSWAFSRHVSGEPHLSQEAFDDRSQFIVDDERYAEFLGQLIGTTGSLRNAFQAAHTLCGAMGGLLTHKERGGAAGIQAAHHPEQFERTAAYDEWLRSSTEELDALEAARQENSAKKDPVKKKS